MASVTVTLTDAQIKALPTTPFQLVAAPGAGKILVVVTSILQALAAAGAYTNIDVAALLLQVYAGTTVYAAQGIEEAESLVSGFLAAGAARYATTRAESLPADTALASINNKAIHLWLDNAAAGVLTGGNVANSLEVTVYYIEVTL